MQLIFIGIPCAIVAALIIRAAVRRHARGKCRSLVAVAKAVLEDGFGSEIGGRNALDRLTDASAIRARHGFPVTDLGLKDEAELDALFSRAIAAATGSFRPPAEPPANPAPPNIPKFSEEARPAVRGIPVADAFDFSDAPTLTDITAPSAAEVTTVDDAAPAEIDDDAPTIPGFRIPQALLDETADSEQEPQVNVDLFGGRDRENLN